MMHTHTSGFNSRLEYLPKGKTKLVIPPKWKAKVKEFNQFMIDHKKAKRRKEHAQGMLYNAIGLCISLSLVFIAFEWKSYEQGNLINLGSSSAEFEEILDIPVTQQPPPPPPKTQAVTIIEVPDIEEIEEEIDLNLDVEVTEESVMQEVNYEMTQIEEEEVEEVFLFVEQAPQPTGGMKEFYNDVAQRIIYPAMARRMGIEGKVYIQFIIDTDGSLTNMLILKGIGAGCDEEAVRVLNEAPKWEPGKQRGIPVKVQMAMPILFQLE